MNRILLGFLATALLTVPLLAGCKTAKVAANLVSNRTTFQQDESGKDTIRLTGKLEEGDSLRHDDESFEDQYNVRFEAGDTVRITMTAKNFAFDTYLLVSDPEGEEAGQNDDCVDGDPAQGSCLAIIVTKTGNYTIHANSFEAGEVGEYDIVIEKL